MAKKTPASIRAYAKQPEKASQPATDMVESSRAMAFSKINYILVAVGMVIVVIGFILMSGGGTTTEAFDPDIFSVRRIKVAPMVCLFGFLFIVFAILYHKKSPEMKTDDGPELSVTNKEATAAAATKKQ